VKDAVLMSKINGSANGRQIASGITRRQWPLRCDLAQRGAFHVLHREKRLAIAFPHVIDLNDIRMIKPGSRLGFGPKAVQIGLGGQLTAKDHFERDQAIETFLSRLVDHAHASPAEFLKKLIIAKSAWQGRLRGKVQRSCFNSRSLGSLLMIQ